jgi:phosphomannomutase
MAALYDAYAVQQNPTQVLDFDGYRIEFDQWWFNVRKSNTEPYLRVVAEAKTPKLLTEKVDEINSIIHSFS